MAEIEYEECEECDGAGVVPCNGSCDTCDEPHDGEMTCEECDGSGEVEVESEEEE